MALDMATLSGSGTTLSEEQIGELRMGFRGALITPQDAGYDEARTLENLHIDRRPGLIIRCSGTADVIDASTSPGSMNCWWPCVAAATTSPATA